MNKVRTLTLRDLRKIIKEEADMLQGKDDPKDVKPTEMAWEDAEDVGRQDFISQMDKPSPAVKAESRLRVLKTHAGQLRSRLQETLRRIAAYEKVVTESKKKKLRRSI